MTKVNIQITPLAAAIYAQQVDLERPLLHKEQVAACFRAARAFEDYYNEEIAPHIEESDDLETVKIVLEQLRMGQKIPAIKEHRARTGLGLKESKDFVDNLEQVLKKNGKLPDDDDIEIYTRSDGTKTVRRKTSPGLKI